MSEHLGRVVSDGGGMGYQWRAAIIPSPSPFRRRLGWRFVMERHFMGWDYAGRSRWFADEQDCIQAAHAWLDSKEPLRRHVGRRATEQP